MVLTTLDRREVDRDVTVWSPDHHGGWRIVVGSADRTAPLQPPTRPGA